jgi:hypothetical protein
MPAALNAGLSAWNKASWYLEECDVTEAGTGVPRYWRLGPKPNLKQIHDSYKKQALKTRGANSMNWHGQNARLSSRTWNRSSLINCHHHRLTLKTTVSSAW